jgi:hypothetical protein
MQAMRKVFGWFFALCFVAVSLSASLRLLHDVIQRDGTLHLRALIPSGVLVLLGILFAMAWWSTWRDKPTARTWGIIASLVNLSILFSVAHFTHRPLHSSGWELLVVNVFALVTYIWPDPEPNPYAVAQTIDESDE